MVRPSAEQVISTSSRRNRVTSRLALMIQKVLVRRYQGGWAWKNVQARRFRRSLVAYAGLSRLGRDSNE
jgi:hypothetical protein